MKTKTFEASTADDLDSQMKIFLSFGEMTIIDIKFSMSGPYGKNMFSALIMYTHTESEGE